MTSTVGRRYAIAAACLTSLFAVSNAFTSNGTRGVDFNEEFHRQGVNLAVTYYHLRLRLLIDCIEDTRVKFLLCTLIFKH